MPESNIEKFRHGQFSLSPEEKKEAVEKGTLAEKEKKMEAATTRLQGQQGEKILRETVKALKKESEKEN
jgi:hypothetical protein